MKFRRSERLIDMTYYLLEHPRELVSLTFFRKGTVPPNPPLVRIWEF